MLAPDDLKNNPIWIALTLLAIGAFGTVGYIAWLDIHIDERTESIVRKKISTYDLAVIPDGAIVAFDIQDECPKGWVKYDLASGRSLVGVGERPIEQPIKICGVENHAVSQQAAVQRKTTTSASTLPSFSCPPDRMFEINNTKLYKAEARRLHSLDSDHHWPEFVGVVFCKKTAD